MSADLVHLRVWLTGRYPVSLGGSVYTVYRKGEHDRWDELLQRGSPPRWRPYQRSRSACERDVWTADTYATPRSGPKITCPECSVFCDAWLAAQMRGRVTLRRVRAFKRDHLAGAIDAPARKSGG